MNNSKSWRSHLPVSSISKKLSDYDFNRKQYNGIQRRIIRDYLNTLNIQVEN